MQKLNLDKWTFSVPDKRNISRILNVLTKEMFPWENVSRLDGKENKNIYIQIYSTKLRFLTSINLFT